MSRYFPVCQQNNVRRFRLVRQNQHEGCLASPDCINIAIQFNRNSCWITFSLVFPHLETIIPNRMFTQTYPSRTSSIMHKRSRTGSRAPAPKYKDGMDAACYPNINFRPLPCAQFMTRFRHWVPRGSPLSCQWKVSRRILSHYVHISFHISTTPTTQAIHQIKYLARE